MEKTQREYYLNEQLKAIQKELGEIEDGKDETSNLNKAILKAKMPKDVEKKCLSELKKLKNMSPMSAEATVVRNYLDWMMIPNLVYCIVFLSIVNLPFPLHLIPPNYLLLLYLHTLPTPVCPHDILLVYLHPLPIRLLV